MITFILDQRFVVNFYKFMCQTNKTPNYQTRNCERLLDYIDSNEVYEAESVGRIIGNGRVGTPCGYSKGTGIKGKELLL